MDEFKDLQAISTYDYNRVNALYINGSISENVYAAYCWLWRNLQVRYSTIASEYEGITPGSNYAHLVEQYKNLMESKK